MPRIDKLRFYLEMEEKYFIDSIQEFFLNNFLIDLVWKFIQLID